MFRKILLGIVFLMIASLLSPPILRGASAQADCDLEWIVRYLGKMTPASDTPYKVVIDSFENIYVTGTSPCPATGNDYLTIKYDPAGNEVWKARYDGAGGDDVPYDIAVDSSGYVYVTGRSIGIGGKNDYATIKYNSTGEQLWAERYDGAGIDIAYAIALDSDGNAYVTGRSYANDTNDDYLTVKYLPNGVQSWIARYDGPKSGADVAYDIAVDNVRGCLFVTGRSEGTETLVDYATIKYDGETGNQLEGAARYDNELANDNDRAYALAIHEQTGNVYVTGTSYGGSSTLDDYATLKYDSNLNQLWVARFDGAGKVDIAALSYQLDIPNNGIAVDSAGNVYVTGRSIGTSADFATVKYDTSGNQLWVARFDRGPADYAASCIALYEDPILGDVSLYVIGQSFTSDRAYDFAIVEYSGFDGYEEKVVFYDGGLTPMAGDDYGIAIAVSETGHVAVVGKSTGLGTSWDYATMMFDSYLNPLWLSAARHDGDPVYSPDIGNAVAVGEDGNVYVTGQSGGGAVDDYATLGYNPDGTVKWGPLYYNGPKNAADSAYDIAVDSKGNVYVTGQSGYGTSYDTRCDYATIKYDANGNQLWVARYHNTESVGDYSPNDFGRAVAVYEDPETGSAFVYVTGSSWGKSEADGSITCDYATVKYDGETGTELWHVRYNAGLGDGTYPHSIALDSAGNVYVTGWSEGSETGCDAATVKYDKDGNEVWVARYNGPGNGYDDGTGIAIDYAGNVYVTGWSVGIGTGYDIATIKYDGVTGIELWARRYHSGIYDHGEKIAVDSAGNVYVTGSCRNVLFDYVTIKYDTEGNELWADLYDGPAENSNDYATDIAIDWAGNIYVTGRSSGSGTGFDYLTIKYDAAGNRTCVGRYDAGPEDHATDITLDWAGNIYVTGRSYGIGTDLDYATVKYRGASAIDMIEALIDRVESFNLKQGISNSLDIKLQNVRDSLNAANAGQRSDAVNKLEAFKNQCEAQRGNALTFNQADQLIGHANQIIQSLLN